jgi:hypothetical protein
MEKRMLLLEVDIGQVKLIETKQSLFEVALIHKAD